MSRQNVRAKARGLGAELADLRTQAGLTLREVAGFLDWSAPTLSRIENGRRDTTTEEVAALLVVYKITGARKDHLVRLARTIDQPGWWETSADGIPGQLTALRAFEAEATKIATLELLVVPGILQTAAYARDLLKAGGIPAEKLDDRIAIRLDRQGVLARRRPPELEAIIDETALRRAMADPAIMAGQMRHLVKMAAKPHVTIRVLRDPRHPGTAGPYTELEFPTPAQPFVHLEHFKSSLFLDEPEDVREYQALTATLAKKALSPGESQEFIAHLARRYEDEAKGQESGRARESVAQVQLQPPGDRLR